MVLVVRALLGARARAHHIFVQLVRHHLRRADVQEGSRGEGIESHLQPRAHPRNAHAYADADRGHCSEGREETEDVLVGGTLADELHAHGQGGRGLVSSDGEEESNDVIPFLHEPQCDAGEEGMQADGQEQHEGRHRDSSNTVDRVEVRGLGPMGSCPLICLVAHLAIAVRMSFNILGLPILGVSAGRRHHRHSPARRRRVLLPKPVERDALHE
mmetsp:Transcript_17685/g.57202  ORF Transcript_17685/g.57202 Transcript_17685/m.57202 type:complete len:214 (+) Transcript_17685:267-908(+)